MRKICVIAICAIGLCVGDQRTLFGQVIQEERRFNLWPSERGVVLQSAVFRNDCLYFLQRASEAGSYRVGTLDQHGNQSVLATLAGSQYIFLGVRSSGAIIVQQLGGPLIELDARGVPVHKWPLDKNRRTLAIVDDAVVQLAGSAHAQVTRLEHPQLAVAVSIPNWADSPESLSIGLGNRSVAIVEIERGRAAVVSLTGAASKEFDLPGNGFSVAREKIEARGRDASVVGPSVRYSLVAAIGGEPAGQLLLMPAPYKVDGATIVRSDDMGKVIDEFTIQLPPRSIPGFGIPMTIGRIAGRLCVLFFHGGVSCYAIPPVSHDSMKRPADAP